MNRIEMTRDLHKNGGLSCSQTILTVYGEQYGIDQDMAMVLGRTLSLGVAGQGETCGYVTGALLILAHAYNDNDEAQARKKTHPVVIDFIRRFKERYGTLKCKELLGADVSTNEGLKKFQDEKLKYKNCCCEDGIGQHAAEILESLI
jgi:C_GCAxxG_C_C family probable redox protein